MNPKVGDRPIRVLGKDQTPTGYRQVYIIKQQKEDDLDNTREVFFRCGDHCYEGMLTFDFLQNHKDMSLADIPKVAPALQMQQDDLSFVCLSSR